MPLPERLERPAVNFGILATTPYKVNVQEGPNGEFAARVSQGLVRAYRADCGEKTTKAVSIGIRAMETAFPGHKRFCMNRIAARYSSNQLPKGIHPPSAVAPITSISSRTVLGSLGS